MRYLAVLMSGNHQQWFDSKQEAWDYIYSRSCQSCKESKIDACSAEWDVWSEDEYNELMQDSTEE